MKYLIPILLVFFYCDMYSQNNKRIVATYEILYNTELPNVKKGVLEISNDKKETVFIISSNRKKKKAKKDESGNIIVQSISNKKRFVYLDFSEKTAYTTTKLSSKDYLIKEKVPKIDWVLTDQTKKIGNLNVLKATAKFRGRNYTAWYSMDYPIPFGPWKFQGLPGLIVEIKEETNRYHWILKSIKSEEAGFDFQFNKKDFKEISLKEYVDVRYNKAANFMATKLPRGSRVVSTEIAPRNSIEIEFEWETEKR